MVNEWKEIPLLARTHGQPASPTRLGKEIQVFVTRLEAQFESLKSIPNAANLGVPQEILMHIKWLTQTLIGKHLQTTF